ncbi:NAD-dependent epimerase/dehydratase family protein, partial [Elusimicrobiota bacterium]
MSNPAENRLRRIIILGHKGFVGASLKRHFDDADCGLEVVGLDLPELDLASGKGMGSLSRLLTPDACLIMLAAIKRQFGDTLEAFTQNVKMAVNLCALIGKRPVGRVVFFSSTAVYGEDIHNTGITEDTSVCPTSYYGMAKFASERLFWKAASLHDRTSLVLLRPPTIYGPGDEGDTYGPVRFAKAAAKGRRLTLWGDGTELREFVFIEDVAIVVRKLVFSGYDGVLNLVSGNSSSFRDVLEAVEAVSGRRLDTDLRERTKAKVDNAFRNDRLLEV